jgi:hypothetical protein
MKAKTKIALFVIILITVFSLLWYAFAPYIDAYRVNKNIEIAGVKLLMASSEVEEILGKGVPIGGFGAEFYGYDSSQITIAYPLAGLLKGKAGWIEISNHKYSIYGIRAGDSLEKAKTVLGKHGFLQDQSEQNIFKRGSARISIYEQTIRVTIEDWTIRGRIY